MRKLIFIIMFILPLLLSANVFIWHNENPTFHFFDPEDHILVGGDYGIKKALDSLNVEYDQSSILPADLSSYDAVFVLLGSFCES
ncbi:hypothetical protein ACFLYK_00110 [Candidatus Cloacimonadota bacterium]